MNREETHALFAKGREAWNAWADEMLAKKAELEAAGTGEEEERTWRRLALARMSSRGKPHSFDNHVDFNGWIFPGDALFDNAMFSADAWFDWAKFNGNAGFRGATFAGTTRFRKATFARNAWFRGAVFPGTATFTAAKFVGDATFKQATFTGTATFNGAEFVGDATFNGAGFPWQSGFESAGFTGDASFDAVTFAGDARFGGATFAGDALFGEVIFLGNALFREVEFDGIAQFDGATFTGNAGFDQCTFDSYTSFANSNFKHIAGFPAIQVKRAFTLEDATFQKVPDFIQANFVEAPRLDNVSIKPGFVAGDTVWTRAWSRIKRFFGGDADVPARWRALKRMAIQGHDGVREQEFFAMEIRSARYVTDWPVHWRMLLFDRAAWAGFFRFWFGVLYQIFSDFGRSILRPTVAFIAVALLSASAYLQISEQVGGRAETPFMGRLAATATQAFADPTTLRAAHPCAKVSGADLRSLEPELATRTDALSEAMHLSWSNGSIVGGLGGLDSARRTYGCLYGFVEDAGKNATPVLPPGVSVIATWQKTLSVIFIFLFGLALRNMLKMH